MFLFRAVFITAFVAVAFIAQVSAWILPLSRYMLDAVPEGTENGAEADPNAVGAADASAALSTDTDVPVAVETSPIGQASEAEASALPSSVDASAANLDISSAVPSPSSAVSSAGYSPVAATNAAGHMSALGGTSILLGSVVAGILLAA